MLLDIDVGLYLNAKTDKDFLQEHFLIRINKGVSLSKEIQSLDGQNI